jgi:hypothetical protein
MTLPRGYAFEGDGKDVRAVPFTMPEVDREPEPETVTPPRDFETYANRVLDVLDGPPRTSAARVAALRRIMGRDDRPLRAIAGEIGCSVSTLHDAVKAAEAKLFSRPANTLSEEKTENREHAAHL